MSTPGRPSSPPGRTGQTWLRGALTAFQSTKSSGFLLGPQINLDTRTMRKDLSIFFARQLAPIADKLAPPGYNTSPITRRIGHNPCRSRLDHRVHTGNMIRWPWGLHVRARAHSQPRLVLVQIASDHAPGQVEINLPPFSLARPGMILVPSMFPSDGLRT